MPGNNENDPSKEQINVDQYGNVTFGNEPGDGQSDQPDASFIDTVAKALVLRIIQRNVNGILGINHLSEEEKENHHRDFSNERLIPQGSRKTWSGRGGDCFQQAHSVTEIPEPQKQNPTPTPTDYVNNYRKTDKQISDENMAKVPKKPMGKEEKKILGCLGSLGLALLALWGGYKNWDSIQKVWSDTARAFSDPQAEMSLSLEKSPFEGAVVTNPFLTATPEQQPEQQYVEPSAGEPTLEDAPQPPGLPGQILPEIPVEENPVPVMPPAADFSEPVPEVGDADIITDAPRDPDLEWKECENTETIFCLPNGGMQIKIGGRTIIVDVIPGIDGSADQLRAWYQIGDGTETQVIDITETDPQQIVIEGDTNYYYVTYENGMVKYAVSSEEPSDAPAATP